MTTTLSSDETLLVEAADRARLAPSVHNTQPWSLHLRSGVLELHSDAQRALTTLDPSGRELIISCGAALYELRVALAARGAVVETRPFPDADRPHVVATVRIAGHQPATKSAEALEAAIAERQTNRRAFHKRVTEAEADQLCRAALHEGAELMPIVRSADRTIVKVWQQAADSAQVTDPDYRRELRSWVGTERADDGIPLAAVSGIGGTAGGVGGRDFTLGGDGGVPAELDDPDTSIFLLITNGDDRADWLAAGQALAAAWLEATVLGLAVQPLSQSVENAAARVRLRRDLQLLSAWPQLLLRVGHAQEQPRTPRRPIDAVLAADESPR